MNEWIGQKLKGLTEQGGSSEKVNKIYSYSIIASCNLVI
jgi:hypothetical protein